MKTAIKNGKKEVIIEKITEVRKEDGGWTITKSDGWSLWIDKKYGVTPMVNDTIVVFGEPFGRIQGIQINDKVLYNKTDEEMEKEFQEWREKTSKRYDYEYVELMEKIKDEESFETVDISGMGSSYERSCQLMLRAGIKFLQKHPEFHFDYQVIKGVYGVCWTDTPWGKELDKTISDVVNGDCSGAMHQAVISHLMYIHKHGYTSWLNKFPKESRYVYPKELPTHSFGRKTTVR
jgi:hypothetical protein